MGVGGGGVDKRGLGGGWLDGRRMEYEKYMDIFFKMDNENNFRSTLSLSSEYMGVYLIKIIHYASSFWRFLYSSPQWKSFFCANFVKDEEFLFAKDDDNMNTITRSKFILDGVLTLILR